MKGLLSKCWTDLEIYICNYLCIHISHHHPPLRGLCDSSLQVGEEQRGALGGENDTRNSPEPPAEKGEPLSDPLPHGSSAWGLPLAAFMGRGESPALGTRESSLCPGRVAKSQTLAWRSKVPAWPPLQGPPGVCALGWH